MRRLTALGASLLLLACGQAKETPTQMQTRMAQESGAAKAAIGPIAKGFERWFAAGRADSVATAFTEGGRQLPPNEPAAVGREAIRARNASFFAVYDVKLTVNSESVVANGPLAVERGTFQLQASPKKGAPKGTPPVTDTGKYLQHWEQVNGNWMIDVQTWNSDIPLGPPAAAPAKKAAAKPAAKAPVRSTTKKK